MLGKIRKKYADKLTARAEIKRLEKLMPAFLEEYKVLCLKYNAQLVPVSVNQGNNIRISQRIDSYYPAPQLTPEQEQKLDQMTGAMPGGASGAGGMPLTNGKAEQAQPIQANAQAN